MFGFGIAELFVVFFILLFLFVPTYFIAKILIKAGFSGWFSLLSLIPIINIISLWVFSFISWPIEQNNNQ
jgi:uncharacterized membrane protein YhaH (DUF805 family)